MNTPQSACEGKKGYGSHILSKRNQKDLRRQGLAPFKCPFCGKWHLAGTERNAEKSPKYSRAQRIDEKRKRMQKLKRK